MQYNVAQLLMEPIGSHRSYQLNETVAGPPLLEGQVWGQVNLLHTHQGVLVTAKVEAPVALSCSRCVTSFLTHVWLTVEEEFFPIVDVNTGQWVPLPADADPAFRIDADPAFRIDAGHVLDLTEVLRQCLITETPMKPLCQPQCLGLCRECGANLNLGGCGCGAGRGDPRWGALRALLEQQQA